MDAELERAIAKRSELEAAVTEAEAEAVVVAWRVLKDAGVEPGFEFSSPAPWGGKPYRWVLEETAAFGNTHSVPHFLCTPLTAQGQRHHGKGREYLSIHTLLKAASS